MLPDKNPSPDHESSRRFSYLVTLGLFVLFVLILRVGERILVPLALAALLAFLLTPLVDWLVRRKVGNTLAVILSATAAFIVIGVVVWAMTSQAVNLAQELPRYEQNIDAKVASLKSAHLPGGLAQFAEMAAKFQKELMGAPTSEPPGGAPSPMSVQVAPKQRTPVDLISEVVAPVLGPLETAGIVVVFAVAFLLKRKDLRQRFIRVVSGDDAGVAAEAIDDASGRVSRYLGMQFAINLCYGAAIGAGLYFIGIPNSILWGLLSMILRFIPFVGPWIAAAFPMVLSVAIEPGWFKAAATLGLFIVAELATTNIFEAWLYGSSTGVANVALLVAAVFWGWLWGTAGLFLAMPLTVCLLVLGRYLPGLKFLGTLLESEGGRSQSRGARRERIVKPTGAKP